MVIAVFVILGCGVFYRKKGWFPQTADASVFHVTVNILMPCLILDRIIRAEGLFDDASNLYLPPIMGFGMTLVGILVGFVVAILPKKLTGLDSWKSVCTFAACVGILNYGFVPIPLVDHLFQDEGKTTGVLFVQNLGTELSIWTIVVMTMGGRVNRSVLWRAVNAPTCAIVIAIIINITHIGPHIPKFLVNTIHLFGGASIPISIFLIGLSLADLFDGKRLLANWKKTARIAFWSCLIRLVVLPGLFLWTLLDFPCSLEMKRVIVVHAAMSSAIFPIVLSKHYSGDESTAMDVILSNTLFGLITTPIWVSLGLRMIG